MPLVFALLSTISAISIAWTAYCLVVGVRHVIAVRRYMLDIEVRLRAFRDFLALDASEISHCQVCQKISGAHQAPIITAPKEGNPGSG